MASIAQFNTGFSSATFFGQCIPLRPPQLADSYKKPCLITMKIKPWERKKVKPNGLPILKKMHVKLGDTIQVISGREKGKVGEIMKIYTHNSTIIVKDINLKTKHMKGRQEGEAGQIIEIEGPLHSSNVMLYSKTQNMASRVGHKILEDGKKVRFLLKTGEILDSPEEWKRIFKEKDDKKD